MEIRPFGKHVILEPLEAPEKIGQIFLTDEHKDGIEKRAVGMVAAVGGKVNESLAEMGEPPIEVGQIVVYWKPASGSVQGKDLKQKIYCTVDGLIGLVTRDDHASTEEFKAEIEKSKRREQDFLGKVGGSRLVQASGAVPRIVE